MCASEITHSTLPYDYPAEPPAWLARWPDNDRLTAMFAEGVRRMAPRIMRQGAPARIRWSTRALTMEVGRKNPYWRLVDEVWQTGCSCGYPGGKCPHVYAAAVVFGCILSQEGWGDPDRERLASPPERFDAFRSRTPHAPQARTQGELFAWADTPLETAARALQVEIEFHYAPGMVAIRFYEFKDRHRSVLRMQQLHNLAIVSRQGVQERDGWNDDDRRFLAWLDGRVFTRQVLRENLNLLKVPTAQFAQWQERWADCPQRFIERATQQFILPGGGTASAHIELSHVDGGVEIALVVATPTGRNVRFHELAGQLAAGGGQFLLDGQAFSVTFPVAANLLVEVFAKRSPVVPADKVCAHLPPLVHNRLDLVRGPAVRRREMERPLSLVAETAGGEVFLTARLGDAGFSPTNPRPQGDIVRENDHFVITLYSSPHAPAVREFLQRVGAEAQDEAGRFRLPGRHDAIRAFVAGWQGLPGGVDRRVGPDLATLFGDGLHLRPTFAASDSGGFVDIHVAWRDAANQTTLSADEVAEATRRGGEIVRTRGGHWLKLDLSAVEAGLNELQQFGFDAHGRSRMMAPEADRFFQSAKQTHAWTLAPDTRDLAARLARRCAVRIPRATPRMETILRHYQREGFEFLADRSAHRVGAILADDMGLGKTVQVLALLTATAELNAGAVASVGRCGALVVCPASVVGVWLCEVRKFCPELRCQAYQGPPDERRQALSGGAADWDILVVNYTLLRNDVEVFCQHEYAYVILDEAHQIKNPEALVTQAVKRLKTPCPLAMTGTPVENRIADLWSIMDFLNPGFLGRLDDFKLSYDTPERRRGLSRRIAPVILRRTKELVAPELPPKTEELMSVEMGASQAAFYRRELESARAGAMGGGAMALFAALTRMRQICCDPRLLDADYGESIGSAKLELLMEMVEEILDEGHSVLVFSQFTSMLSLIENRFRKVDVPYRKITGATPPPTRPQIVEAFNQQRHAGAFLLSLKAAGTGLTLTKADYVILYDPWWNPAVENQAIDRTHRIGQDKPVFAYRLIVRNTVEEKVLALQQEKAALFAQVMADSESMGVPRGLTHVDLEKLLA